MCSNKHLAPHDLQHYLDAYSQRMIDAKEQELIDNHDLTMAQKNATKNKLNQIVCFHMPELQQGRSADRPKCGHAC